MQRPYVDYCMHGPIMGDIINVDPIPRPCLRYDLQIEQPSGFPLLGQITCWSQICQFSEYKRLRAPAARLAQEDHGTDR